MGRQKRFDAFGRHGVGVTEESRQALAALLVEEIDPQGVDLADLDGKQALCLYPVGVGQAAAVDLLQQADET
jgi:plasmid stability protein